MIAEMPVERVAELGLVVVMLAGPSWVLWGRFRSRPKDDTSPKGIGVRIIQLLGILLLVPLIGILALEGKLNGDTTGALLGVAIGYTLSGIEKAVPSNKTKEKT
jgi:hypothetical protein